MKNWQLTADSPLSLRFAADARLGRTDYADDQSWEIAFGGPEEPALAIQTRYGGRAGLARLVPMWVFDGRSVFEGMGFAERPVLRAFAPNYARITARPINNLNLTAEIWVMESHAIGGRVTLENRADRPVAVRFELHAQAVRNEQMLEMNLLGLDDGTEALHMGRIGNLNPVLLLERATPHTHGGRGASTKLATPLTIPAGGSATLRWVHAGMLSLDDSLQTAYRWLYKTDWDAEIKQIEALNASTPQIETGNADWDAALAFSAHVNLRSFIGPTGSLPYPSYVAARIPARGFSPRGDGTDHGWQWSGQMAALGYLALPSTAILAPDLAMGALRNALAVRQPDGWIDFKPGLGGQRAQMLSAPLLAATAWRIYEITEDRAFVGEVFPGLRAFFERWFQADADGDGVPEWENTTQSGYTENPIFARFRRWAQNADISKAESPDLAAYLIGEGESLLKMAALVGDTSGDAAIRSRIEKLKAALETMWRDDLGTYLYRDRDTDRAETGINLFRGKGDEAFDVKTPLDPPNRLILRVIGGKETAPRVSAVIEGVDARGNHVAETVPTSAFAWYYGMGAAVTEHVYSQVNYLKFEGLIRLYSLEVDTVDLRRQNLTQLMPLWATELGKERASQIVATLCDTARYWRAHGLPVCPANDPAFAPNNDGGSGGVWMQWNVLIIEGLLRHGYVDEAAALFRRLFETQVRALRRDRAFREAFNSETGDGLGDIDDLNGVLPLSLFMQMIGLRIVNARKVYAGGVFTMPNPVKVTQFGIEVTRSASGTQIRFPSGYTAETGPDWTAIEDPTPEKAPELPPEAARPPAAPAPEAPTRAVQPRPAPATLEDTTELAPIPNVLPEDVLSIKVDSQKDDTMEIPIDKLDFRKKDKPKEPPSTSGTVKIPVRGPKGEE